MSWRSRHDVVRAKGAGFARLHGVTVDRLVLIHRRRVWFRQNKRLGERTMRQRNKAGLFTRAGEGELHGLLRATGMTEADFCREFGIDRTTFNRWYGHPLHNWPIAALRYYARAQAMGRYLESQGVDLKQFEQELPPMHPGPQYPRKRKEKSGPPVPMFDEKGEWSPWLKPSTSS